MKEKDAIYYNYLLSNSSANGLAISCFRAVPASLFLSLVSHSGIWDHSR
jgi:hypothetical protein